MCLGRRRFQCALAKDKIVWRKTSEVYREREVLRILCGLGHIMGYALSLKTSEVWRASFFRTIRVTDLTKHVSLSMIGPLGRREARSDN